MSHQLQSNQPLQLKHSNTFIQQSNNQLAKPNHITKRNTKQYFNQHNRFKLGLNYFQNLDLKALIKQLKQKGSIQRNKLLLLIQVAQNKLKFQPNVLRVTSPVIIIGDIHGQFFDLLNIFQMNGFPDTTKFLFLGDYVDRGLFCIQVITLLLVLKIKYPQNILLLRGNHQGRVMTMNFNFRLQCQKKYGIQIYEKFLQLFCKLPLCALVDQTYFAVHGGISPQIQTIKQLQKVNRFIEISNAGVVCDLMWSDPAQDPIINDWQPNKMRGCSYYYGVNQTKLFLKTNKIKMIVRGHQVQIQGYCYQKSDAEQKLTLTIFSAPNYCDVYRNKGAIAIIKDNKFAIHKFGQVQHPFVLPNYMNCLQFSIPGVCQLVGKLLIYLLRNRQKSRKQALIDDNILQQLDALKRIQQINEIIEKKIFQNEFALFQAAQKQQDVQQEAKQLQTSYKLSYEAFIQKKSCDEQQMYPDQKVLQTIRERKRTKKMTLVAMKQATKKLIELDNNENSIKQVFGPKLQMMNNISKKMVIQDQQEVCSQF